MEKRLNIREGDRILIYDTAGNPYGRELAALLSSTFSVKALLPVDTEWTPPAISVHRILPSNGPAWLLAQIFRQVCGLTAVAWTVFVGRATVIVVETRGWYDKLFLALIAGLCGRIVVIAHDPVPKWRLPKAFLFSQRILWNFARVVLAHSEGLATQARAAGGRNTKVVPHLPFLEYATWARAIAPDIKSSSACRLLVLGQMRDDKGLDRLPDIFALIPEVKRSQISIAFAGRGDCTEIISKMRGLVAITRVPTNQYLSDVEIAQELAKSDVLLAPYPRVTASGSVVLALCRGMGVIAYDTGALAEVVSPEGLVPLGDEFTFAMRIVAATNLFVGGPKDPLHAWREASLRAWLEALK